MKSKKSEDYLFYELKMWTLTEAMSDYNYDPNAKVLVDMFREEWFPIKLV